jgi:tetratricopeptide (TPR) repeat protein
MVTEIESLISAGELETAIEQLMQFVRGDARWADFEQDVRINQADYYNLKSQQIRGVISAEDERLTRNRITNNIVTVLERIKKAQKTGTTAADVLEEEDGTEPSTNRKLYYYIMGGAVALAIAGAVWYFLKADPCPRYNAASRYRVMVLPFLQTGIKKTSTPAVEIADGLNVLFGNTPALQKQAEALVGKHDITETTYPSFSKAEQLGRDCGVQMVVWGKIRQITDTTYTLDVRYKLMDDELGLSIGDTTLSTVTAGAENAAAGIGDTVLSRLLDMEQQKKLYQDNRIRTKDHLTEDLTAATRYLYAVLANHVRAPVAAQFWQNSLKMAGPAANGGVASAAPGLPPADMQLLQAENFLRRGDTTMALETYTEILEKDPANQEAYLKRGALYYAQKRYKKATDDLQAAAPSLKTASPDLLKTRIESAVRSGQPAQAQADLKAYQTQVKEDQWTEQKHREVQDSLLRWQKIRQASELKANSRPADRKANLEAAKANLATGNRARAEQYAAKVIKSDPVNIPALEILVTSQLAQGDTARAKKTLKEAAEKGADINSMDKWKKIRQ